MYAEMARSWKIRLLWLAIFFFLRLTLLAEDSPADLERKMRLLDENEVRRVISQADAGNPNSQLWAGVIFDVGRHVTANRQTSLAYFKKASDQGSAPAAYFLGQAYFAGDGVKKTLRGHCSFTGRPLRQGIPMQRARSRACT